METTARLSGEPFRLDSAHNVRKGLLRCDHEWFHFSQRAPSVKLRRLTDESIEDAQTFSLHNPESREALAALVNHAVFFAGWAIDEALRGRDQILGGEESVQPPRFDPTAKVVPLTKLRHFYDTLRTFGNDNVWSHLLDACRRHPGDLVALFAQSHIHFGGYDNSEQDFGDSPKHRRPLDDRDQFAQRFVRAVEETRSWSDDPDLAFEYVSREVSPLRTQRARYDDGRSARSSGAGGMDLLLRAAQGGLPIIAEVKSCDDTNVFVALIQSLTYTSETVTAPQRKRLTHPRYNFSRSWAEGVKGPFADIYLIYEAGTDEKVKAGTIELANALLQCPDDRIAKIVRRIVFLRCPSGGGLPQLGREHVATR